MVDFMVKENKREICPSCTDLFDRPRHECGVCGIFNHSEAARLAYFGLYALQHRGQESAGIVSSDGENTHIHKAMGLVPDVFTEEDLQRLKGHLAVGHVRYSTTGASNITNTQPLLVTHQGRTFALAHNGNLVNSRELRNSLEKEGAIFQTTMDSEVILHLLARKAGDFEEALQKSFTAVKGAFSILLMTENSLIAVRDPDGFRPLCLGRMQGDDGESWILASETCALDLVAAEYIRDIAPGEMLIIDKSGMRSLFPWGEGKSSPHHCIFEHVYFARPDSEVFGINVYNARKKMGEILAEEAEIDADLVMPFPDSGNYAALGYAQKSGIPLEFGVIRNHYVGRTFIQPTQSMRDFNVRVKLNPVRGFLKGKRIIIVEDSIIRGTTGRSRVAALRQAGAAEVHMVVSCPPTRYACYYGIDFPSVEQLIAGKREAEEVGKCLGLDSLHYLSLEGMVRATGLPKENFCLACFNNIYPVEPDLNFLKMS